MSALYRMLCSNSAREWPEAGARRSPIPIPVTSKLTGCFFSCFVFFQHCLANLPELMLARRAVSSFAPASSSSLFRSTGAPLPSLPSPLPSPQRRSPIAFARSLSTTATRMSAPKYLTGDKAGIGEFLEKFDVCSSLLLLTSSNETKCNSCGVILADLLCSFLWRFCRSSCSIAMVCR